MEFENVDERTFCKKSHKHRFAVVLRLIRGVEEQTGREELAINTRGLAFYQAYHVPSDEGLMRNGKAWVARAGECVE